MLWNSNSTNKYNTSIHYIKPLKTREIVINMSLDKIYSTFTVGVHFSNMNMIQQINAPVWILWSKSNLSQSLMPLESFTQFNALSHVISACAYLLPVMIISHVISQLPWKGQHVNVVVCYTITNNWSAHVLKTKGICTMQGSGKQWLKKHANAGIFIM